MLRVPTEQFYRVLWKLDLCRRKHFHVMHIPLFTKESPYSFSSTIDKDCEAYSNHHKAMHQQASIAGGGGKTATTKEGNINNNNNNNNSTRTNVSKFSSLFNNSSINHVQDVNVLLKAQANMLVEIPGSPQWLRSRELVEVYRSKMRDNALLRSKNNGDDDNDDNDGNQEEEEENNDYEDVYERLRSFENTANSPTNGGGGSGGDGSLHKKFMKNLNRQQSNEIVFRLNNLNKHKFSQEASKILLSSYLFKHLYEEDEDYEGDHDDNDEYFSDDDEDGYFEFDELRKASRNARSKIAKDIVVIFLEATNYLRSDLFVE
jgi:hypothetical protein